MGSNTGGNTGDVRKSALWGSGNRGGEHRSNALWGKGGRGFVTTVLVVALALPLAAGAAAVPARDRLGGRLRLRAAEGQGKAASERDRLGDHPVRLGPRCGVEGGEGACEARSHTRADRRGGRGAPGQGRREARADPWSHGHVGRTGEEVRFRSSRRRDEHGERTTAPTSSQLWTHETGVNKLWGGPQAPAIAIVDSGIDTSHASFAGGRVVARQAFGSARAARSTAVGTERSSPRSRRATHPATPAPRRTRS